MDNPARDANCMILSDSIYIQGQRPRLIYRISGTSYSSDGIRARTVRTYKGAGIMFEKIVAFLYEVVVSPF